MINKALRGRRKTPGKVSYCVHLNRDRNAINAGIFSNILRAHYSMSSDLPSHIIAIKASNITRVLKGGKKIPMVDGDK